MSGKIISKIPAVPWIFLDATLTKGPDETLPSGRSNERVESLARQEGYIAGVSTRPGMVHNVADMDALTRVRIRGSDTLKDFARKVGASLVASGER